MIATKGKTSELSKRWSSEQVLAFAENLLGLDIKPDERPPVWKKALAWGIWGMPSVDALSYLAQKGAEIAMPYTDMMPLEFRRRQLYQQRTLVELLLRRTLEREDYLRKTLSGFTIIERDSSEARQCRFPAGTPQIWTAYKAHPFDSDFFVPVANFHDFMLHDKKAEFLRIASALGARSVQIVESDASSSSASVEAGVSVGLKGGKINAGQSKGAEQAFSLDFKNASSPSKMPHVPENLRWISGEPLWQAMVETRLNEWATELRVGFKYTSDYGLSADVALGLEGLGVSIGGSYQSQTRVDQEYLVKFWPCDAYENIGRTDEKA